MQDFKRQLTSVLIFFLMIFASVTVAAPGDTIDGYVKSLLAGDWQKARGYWDSDYLDLSERLNIVFSDVEAKYDCASPVFQYRDEILSGTYRLEIGEVPAEAESARVPVRIISPSDTLKYTYHCRKRRDRWCISPVLLELTNSLLCHETKYCRVYFRDSSRINFLACQELDRFIESAVMQLHISQERAQVLPDKKILYFLLDDDEIEDITGYRTKGMYDIPSDAILSSHLPHNHELTHLLMNMAIDSPDLYTAPFLQEGIACHIGGRWGRSPGVIKYTGFVDLNFGLGTLDDILTFDGFHKNTGGPDVSYPLSALFVDYLIRKSGMDGFLLLYRELSGSGGYVASLTRENIRQQVMEVTGLTWADIEGGYGSFWPRYHRFGIQPYDTGLPSDTAVVKITDTIDVSIWELTDIYLFEIDLSRADKGGVFLITVPGDIVDGYASSLYEQQLAAAPYHGERFGIKFTPAEVGVYDYATNELLASFVYGFEPDATTNAFNSKVYRFAVDKLLFGTTDVLDCKFSIIAL